MASLQPRTRESLARFLESAALQREPVESFGQRLVLLRLIFSTGAGNATACIELLDRHGVLIAAYDHDVAAHYHTKKVTSMEHEEWSDVYACLEHAGVSEILAAVGAVHGENLAESPLQRVREALEREVGGAPSAPLLVQAFLALYNIEADRKALLETILQKYQVRNVQDVQINLLQAVVPSHALDLVHEDVAVVLAHTWVQDGVDLSFLRTQVLASGGLGADEEINLRATYARASLFLLRRRAGSTGQADATSHRPHDFPLDAATWRDLSSGQQLVLLFLGASASVWPREDLERMARQIAPRCDAVSLAAYVPHSSQHGRLGAGLDAFSSRIAAVVDTSNDAVNAVLAKFRVGVCTNVFGENVVHALTVGAVVQLSYTCFAPKALRQRLFHGIAVAHNARVRSLQAELKLPETAPRVLLDRMAAWKHKEGVGLELCQVLLPRVCV